MGQDMNAGKYVPTAFPKIQFSPFQRSQGFFPEPIQTISTRSQLTQTTKPIEPYYLNSSIGLEEKMSFLWASPTPVALPEETKKSGTFEKFIEECGLEQSADGTFRVRKELIGFTPIEVGA
jgi:hypothetical protein